KSAPAAIRWLPPILRMIHHSVFINPQNDEVTTVPRHREIRDLMGEKICKDLGLPKMKSGK
ncbi:MAG: hypothetical protein AAB947_02095, partial [Patescibacteria group bacterium]